MVSGQIIGALIAGGVGIATAIVQVKYELKKRDERKKENWENRMDHLIERLNPPFDNEEMERFSEKQVQMSHQEGLRQTHSLLEEHISNAPFRLSDEFWEQYHWVNQAFSVATAHTTPSDEFTRDSRYLYDRAKELQDYF